LRDSSKASFSFRDRIIGILVFFYGKPGRLFWQPALFLLAFHSVAFSARIYTGMNKRRNISVFLLLFFSGVAFSQEAKTISAGGLVEANANTRHGYGLAGGLMADYGITDRIAAGLKADFGSDFYDVSSLEAMAFGRCYFLNAVSFSLFAQLGAGAIVLYEDGKSVPSVLGDGSVGVRFPLNNFYTEQYVRFGWPTGFGFGFVLGYRFDLKPKKPAVAPVEPPAAPIEPPVVEPERVVVPDAVFVLFAPYVSTFAFTGEEGQRLLDRNLFALKTVSDFMTSHPDYNLELSGYANPVSGTAMEAQTLLTLSQQRAAYVKDRLVTFGVEADRITVSALGTRGADPADFQRNRRVDFRFVKTP
jgi:outer membrane protein OmpA-like peptidoglycan-associated protein